MTRSHVTRCRRWPGGGSRQHGADRGLAPVTPWFGAEVQPAGAGLECHLDCGG